MTNSEDVYRVVNTKSPNEHTIEYLNARIQALQNRVQFLEAKVEVLTEQHINYFEDE